MPTSELDGLELDLEKHEYRFQGKPVPGVSKMLAGLNLVDTAYFTDWARERGIAVHAALEIHMGGGLDWDTVDDRIKGYVAAGVNFLSEAGVSMGPNTHIERPLYHPVHRFAGCPDLVGDAYSEPSVVDYKTGGLGAAGVATALYEMLARVAYPLPKANQTRRRIAVQLFPDGRFKKHDLRDGFDYSWATSVISLYHQFIFPKGA